jgi:hypothetical protein
VRANRMCRAARSSGEAAWPLRGRAKIHAVVEPGKLSQDVVWLEGKRDCDRVLAEARKG